MSVCIRCLMAVVVALSLILPGFGEAVGRDRPEPATLELAIAAHSAEQLGGQYDHGPQHLPHSHDGAHSACLAVGHLCASILAGPVSYAFIAHPEKVMFLPLERIVPNSTGPEADDPPPRI